MCVRMLIALYITECICIPIPVYKLSPFFALTLNFLTLYSPVECLFICTWINWLLLQLWIRIRIEAPFSAMGSPHRTKMRVFPPSLFMVSCRRVLFQLLSDALFFGCCFCDCAAQIEVRTLVWCVGEHFDFSQVLFTAAYVNSERSDTRFLLTDNSTAGYAPCLFASVLFPYCFLSVCFRKWIYMRKHFGKAKELFSEESYVYVFTSCVNFLSSLMIFYLGEKICFMQASGVKFRNNSLNYGFS